MFAWVNEPLTEWGRWLAGVAMMTVSLFLGARMGVFQEHIYIKYGKYPQEALYYTVSLTTNILTLNLDIDTVHKAFEFSFSRDNFFKYCKLSFNVNVFG